MTKQLTGSAKKVQDFLVDNGFSCTVKELPESTRTAEEAAKAIGCEVAQIAKSLIFIDRVSGNPILVIASGVHQVDINKIDNSTGLHLINSPYANRATFGLKRKLSRSSSLERPNI